MQTAPDHTALARWLLDRLRQGIAITDDVSAFMEATLGTADLAVLHSDPADGETDSLLELIFYPDIDAQLDYEARWGRDTFTDRQCADVIAALCAANPQVPLRQGEAEALTVAAPDFALAAFVQRLNITRQLPRPLDRAIADAWPGPEGLMARVTLRNAQLDWQPHRADLAALFFSQDTGGDAAILDLLPDLLDLIAQLPADTAPYDFFGAQKFISLQSLCKAEDFERRRQSANMEIMMLQGHRAAFGSVAQWRQRMRRIDAICRHLFGRTHFFQQPGDQCIDIQAGAPGQQIADIVRMLS